MNDAPGAIPWYKSAVLRGLLMILSALAIKILTQVLKKYQVDLDLGLLGLSADTLTDYIMDAVIPAAVGYAIHGRATKPLPAVTLTKAAADAANANSVNPTQPAQPAMEPPK